MENKRLNLIKQMRDALESVHNFKAKTHESLENYALDQISYTLCCLDELETLEHLSSTTPCFTLYPIESVLIKPGETKEVKTNINDFINLAGYEFHFDGVLDNRKANIYFEMNEYNEPVIKIENLFPKTIKRENYFDLLITADSKLGTIDYQKPIQRKITENK